MRIIRTYAYARAGLVGNPSDGYFGKTISLIVKNFSAKVVMYEWPELEIIPSAQDQCRFDSLESMVQDLTLNGYYGGLRLIKATIKTFANWCRSNGKLLHNKNFSLRYESNIPRQVGLAGSSAIVTATMRALCEFYQVEIPKPLLPSIILSVEKDELGIGAGLQDRVAQVYEGLTYMDFEQPYLETNGHGRYESLDLNLLPPIYIAYQENLAESSEVFHNNIRQRYLAGEPIVVESIRTIANLAQQAREALLSRNYELLNQLINLNFDTRRKIYNLSPAHITMVELARSCGASAKFAGSGGAIIGIYRDQDMFDKLKTAFAAQHCALIKPIVA